MNVATTVRDGEEADRPASVNFRVEPHLKARMQKQAQADNRTLSNWFRAVVMRELERVGG